MKVIKVLGDQILVKQLVVEDNCIKLQGGIVMPTSTKERQKPLVCEILKVGPGKKDKEGNRCPMDVEVGDKVLVPNFANKKETWLDCGECFFIEEDDILAVVEM